MTEETPKPPSGPAVPAGQGPADEPPADPGPVAAASSVPADRPAPAPVGEPYTREELQHLVDGLAGHFPAHYDRTELVLLEVDPHHLHAYWTIHQTHLAKALRELGAGGPQGPMLLRVREVLPEDGEGAGTGEVFDLAVHGLRNRWYVDLWKDGAVYEAALGLRGANGHVVWLARSNRVAVPRAGQSPDYAFPKLTVPARETRLADLPQGVPFGRPRVDPRFVALFPQAGAAVPQTAMPTDREAVAAELFDALEAGEAALSGEVPAGMARLPEGISAGATAVPAGAEPPPTRPGISGVPALAETPPAADAEAAAGEGDEEAERGEEDEEAVLAAEYPGAPIPHYQPPEPVMPGHVADERIARLATGEPMPAEAGTGPAPEPERVAGLGAMVDRLARTMYAITEPEGSEPSLRMAVPPHGEEVPGSGWPGGVMPGEEPGPDHRGPPHGVAVFGADIDKLGPTAPFGPRGEPVIHHPEGAAPPDHHGPAAPEGEGHWPEAGNGAAPPGAPPADQGEPLPLESVLSLSSFAFGREDVSLEVNAELHIFGRARPGAKLTMFGQRLRLLPDGSFSIRRPLPHGSLVLPILMSQGLGAGEGGGGD